MDASNWPIGAIVLIKRQHIGSIQRITSHTKTGFKTSGDDESAIYSFISGDKKGGDKWSARQSCEVISPERAAELKSKWAENRKAAELRSVIEKQLKTATLEQIESVAKIFEQ